MDEGVRLREQGGDSGSMQLILLKKYFSTNTDLSVLSANSVLLKNIYSQVYIQYVAMQKYLLSHNIMTAYTLVVYRVWQCN